MPKHVITFNLPEEAEDLQTTMRAGKYFSTLADISKMLRSMTKYGAHPTANRELTVDEAELANCIRDHFYTFLRENDLEDECI